MEKYHLDSMRFAQLTRSHRTSKCAIISIALMGAALVANHIFLKKVISKY